jgi:hypothetical protein
VVSAASSRSPTCAKAHGDDVEEATGMPEARLNEGTVGRNAHAHAASPRRGIRCPSNPPKRLGRRENARFPGQVARSPDSARRPRGESRGKVAGNIRGAGARRSYRWQTSIGRIARLVRWEIARSRGGNRALAGRKLEAPPDAGHEWREGETVREQAKRLKVHACSACGFRLASSRDDRRRSRIFRAFLLSPAKCSEVLRLGGQLRWSVPRGLDQRPAHRTARRPARACLRVTQENVRGRHGSVKAPRGPRRSEGSPHPRR